MSIVDILGFDDGSLSRVITVSGAITNGVAINSTQQRTGSGCLMFGAGNNKTYRILHPVALTTGFYYIACRMNALPGSGDSGQSFSLCENGSPHLRFAFRSDGRINLYRGPSTTLLATSTFALTVGVWFQMAIKFTIDTTTGIVQVRFNGASTNDINFSGNTRNGGSAVFNHTDFGNWGAQLGDALNTQAHDDIVVQDTTGSAPENDWLGDIEARPITVTADDSSTGYVVGGTTPVATLWDSVNDATPDELVTTIDSSAVGDYASFVVTDLPSGGGTVYAVAVQMRAMKTAAGFRQINGRIDLGGTVALSGALTLSNSMDNYLAIFHRDPSSAAWTPTNVNAAKLGVRTAA